MNAHDKFLQGMNAAVAVTPLARINPRTDLSPMVRGVNRGLMVAFINADLVTRASLDVRHSIVLYDEDGLFEYAMNALPSDAVQRSLIAKTKVRSYSVGV